MNTQQRAAFLESVLEQETGLQGPLELVSSHFVAENDLWFIVYDCTPRTTGGITMHERRWAVYSLGGHRGSGIVSTSFD